MNSLYVLDERNMWSPLGTQTTALLGGLALTEDHGMLRFYTVALLPQSATSPVTPATITYALRVSDDEGATWSEHLMSTEGALTLHVVDPTRADRIVVAVAGTPEQVLVSDDAGASFREYARVTRLSGVTMAPDGRVWIGDVGDRSNPKAPRGIWTAPSLESPLVQLQSDYGVSCLTYSAASDTLYACDYWRVGAVDLSTGAFAVLADLSTVKEFPTCTGKDVAAICEAQLCSGVCELTHFPTAPVCSAYSNPSCGPASVLPQPPASTPSSSAAGPSSTAGVGGPAQTPAASQDTSHCGVGSTGGIDLFRALGAGLLYLIWKRRNSFLGESN